MESTEPEYIPEDATRLVHNILEVMKSTIAGWKKIPQNKENWELVMELELSQSCFR